MYDRDDCTFKVLSLVDCFGDIVHPTIRRATGVYFNEEQMPAYTWYTAHDDKLRSSIISLLNRELLSLPREADFLPKAPPRPHTQLKSHRRTHTKLGSTLPLIHGHRKSRPGELTELTLTYVGILQRSEDFNRRAMMRDELSRRSRMQVLMDQFNCLVPLLLGLRNAVFQQETTIRNQLILECTETSARLEVLEKTGRQLARRREGSKPQCHILARGKGSMITESARERSYVEFCWRGGVDLGMIAVVLDDRGGVVGVATSGEGVRTKGRLLLLRPLLDYDGNCGNGSGGSRMTFQLNLSSCPVNVAKIVFCVCPRGASESLRNLRQSWVTISDWYDGQQRQLLTVSCPPLDVHGSLVVASLRRRHDTAWQFFNELSSIAGHRRYQNVALVVSALETQDPVYLAMCEESFNRSGEEMRECEDRELLLRSLLAFEQDNDNVSILTFVDSVLKRRPKRLIHGIPAKF